MTYTYKLGNGGPIAEIDDDIKISKEDYIKGGVFSGDCWNLHYQTPTGSGVAKIEKSTRIHSIGQYKIKLTW